MTSPAESGHATNLANFNKLTAYATGYGVTYNPSNLSLALASMRSLSSNAQNAMSAVDAVKPAYSIARAAREVAFIPLSALTTRVFNALKATTPNPKVAASAKTLMRKIHGSRATRKMSDEEKQVLTTEGREVKEISASQMSFDNRLENFYRLITLLSNIPTFTPNEVDLQPASLMANYSNLKALNTAVVDAIIPLSNARIARDEILYRDTTGLCDVAGEVKAYIKSVFGANSPQYKQVSGLRFTRPR